MPAQLKEIFKQTNPYYQQGAPLLLEAHALYEDTTTEKLVAQLKWRNLSHQTVQAVNVILHCKDSFGATLETTHYQYVDVSVAPQAIFGTQNPIELVNALTRQCSVSITGVSFGDGSIWTATGDDACEALPAGKAQTLSGDMLFQFKRDLNSEHIDAASQYTPQTYADLWQCGCGNWQKQADEACIKCEATMAKLAELSEPAALAEHLTAYQQAEEQKRIARAKAAAEKKAKEEADRLAREKQAELNRQAAAKTKKRSIIIASVLAVAVAAALVFTLVIQPKQKYDAASAMLANGQYDEAFAAFSEIESYGDVKAIIQQVIQPKQKYDAASAMLANGQYDEAFAAFSEIESYGDVKALIQNDENLAAAALEAKFTVGNTIAFGSYEQDHNTSNGAEAIEWLVLAREGDRALVISVDCLDCVRYHTEYTNTTWETSTLRTWMNDTFLNTAFTQTEQQAIPTVPITTPKNPDYGTNPGNDTKDKVFCLSIQEAESLFSSDRARQSKPTPYAEKQGVYTNYDGYGCWWLRSPGYNQCYAASVNSDGSVDRNGWYVDYDNTAVRPALWLDLTSGIF